MHSRIYQISTKPIGEYDRLAPEHLYGENYSFCDYIGIEDDEETRIEDIGYLQETLKDIFALEDDHLVYKGGLTLFVADWNRYLQNLTFGLQEEQSIHSINMYRIKNATEDTHLGCSFRFYIDEWNGWPGPTADLIDFLQHQVKPGDKLYIGAVIDYHF